MYDVTMRRSRVTSDVVENHKLLYILCVRFLRYPPCPAMRMRHNVICARTRKKNFFHISHKWLDFSEKL